MKVDPQQVTFRAIARMYGPRFCMEKLTGENMETIKKLATRAGIDVNNKSKDQICREIFRLTQEFGGEPEGSTIYGEMRLLMDNVGEYLDMARKNRVFFDMIYKLSNTFLTDRKVEVQLWFNSKKPGVGKVFVIMTFYLDGPPAIQVSARKKQLAKLQFPSAELNLIEPKGPMQLQNLVNLRELETYTNSEFSMQGEALEWINEFVYLNPELELKSMNLTYAIPYLTNGMAIVAKKLQKPFVLSHRIPLTKTGLDWFKDDKALLTCYEMLKDGRLNTIMKLKSPEQVEAYKIAARALFPIFPNYNAIHNKDEVQKTMAVIQPFMSLSSQEIKEIANFYYHLRLVIDYEDLRDFMKMNYFKNIAQAIEENNYNMAADNWKKLMEVPVVKFALEKRYKAMQPYQPG